MSDKGREALGGREELLSKDPKAALSRMHQKVRNDEYFLTGDDFDIVAEHLTRYTKALDRLDELETVVTQQAISYRQLEADHDELGNDRDTEYERFQQDLTTSRERERKLIDKAAELLMLRSAAETLVNRPAVTVLNEKKDEIKAWLDGGTDG